jgi:hypothetical protein
LGHGFNAVVIEVKADAGDPSMSTALQDRWNVGRPMDFNGGSIT